MRERSGRGKTSATGPAGPGPFSYGNEERGGAAAWLRCPPSSARDRGVHRLRPWGEHSRSKQSPLAAMIGGTSL